MEKKIQLTENDIRTMVKECVYSILNEHRDVVNELETAEEIIRNQWSSPDDFWYIKIDQRYKDFRHFNKRHNSTSKWWREVHGPDGTSRENHVGFAIVKGNSVDEAINCLRNIKVKLNPWAQKQMGMAEVQSYGKMEGIILVCNQFFARAYMTINKRSMELTQKRVEHDKATGLFGNRSFNHRAGQARSGIDASGHDWDKERPWTLIDCDIDDIAKQKELEDFISQHHLQHVKKYESHDGMHYLFSTPEIAGLNFNSFFMAKTNNRAGDPPVLAKRDANMILYSPCGI